MNDETMLTEGFCKLMAAERLFYTEASYAEAMVAVREAVDIFQRLSSEPIVFPVTLEETTPPDVGRALTWTMRVANRLQLELGRR